MRMQRTLRARWIASFERRRRRRAAGSGLAAPAGLCDRLGVVSTFDLLDLHPTDVPTRFALPVRKELCTPFGFLYGGSGIAASVEAAERASGRPLQWITTQFIGSPAPGETVDLEVTLPAHGKATSQAQTVGTVTDPQGRTRPVFTSLSAHTERPGGDVAGFLTMPEVPGPHDCPPMAELFAVAMAGTFFDHLERRVAAGRFAVDAVDDPQTGPMAMWCRLHGDRIGSAATQAFVADVVPLAVCAALGSLPGGTSLDNTVRVIDPEPSEWVLLELVPEGYHRSIGHGSLRLWSADGRLIGTAQQTCIIRTSHHDRR
jgi:acyl-CoA thioesterase